MITSSNFKEFHFQTLEIPKEVASDSELEVILKLKLKLM